MPGLRMHLTVDRVRAIVRATLTVADNWEREWPSQTLHPENYSQFEEECLELSIANARAITYPPAIRGTLGGHAKARAHPVPGGVSNAIRAKRRAARLAARLEEESRIGSVRITR